MVITSAAAQPPLPPDSAAPDRNTAANNRAISAAVKLLNDAGAAGPLNRFSIAIDPATRKAVVRVVNSETNELVEQFPSEYLLEVAQALSAKQTQQTSRLVDKSL